MSQMVLPCGVVKRSRHSWPVRRSAAGGVLHVEMPPRRSLALLPLITL